MLVDARVDLGQGYRLGRPGPPWASTAPQARRRVAVGPLDRTPVQSPSSASGAPPMGSAEGEGIPSALGLREDPDMLTKILATLSEVTAAKALPVVGVALAAGTATVGATGVTKSTAASGRRSSATSARTAARSARAARSAAPAARARRAPRARGADGPRTASTGVNGLDGAAGAAGAGRG